MASSKKKRVNRGVPRLSHLHRPKHLEPADWQRALRRQFGREQDFVLQNIGDEPVFSEFLVSNPKTRSSWRVATEGLRVGSSELLPSADVRNEHAGTYHRRQIRPKVT